MSTKKAVSSRKLWRDTAFCIALRYTSTVWRIRHLIQNGQTTRVVATQIALRCRGLYPLRCFPLDDTHFIVDRNTICYFIGI